MPQSSASLILYPVFAMFALTAAVLVRMARLRVGAVTSGEMDVRFYRTYQDGEEPEHIRVVTRHFLNLFEAPVLFYVGVILAFVTHHTGAWMVGWAWAYVAARYAHSYVHLTSNNVALRFRLYIGSWLVLTVLWTSLLLGLVSGN